MPISAMRSTRSGRRAVIETVGDKHVFTDGNQTVTSREEAAFDFFHLQTGEPDDEPPVTTRIYANDGSLMSEYAHERRLYLPIQAVPEPAPDARLPRRDRHVLGAEHRRRR
mgnify:CR=1 FL=1